MTGKSSLFSFFSSASAASAIAALLFLSAPASAQESLAVKLDTSATPNPQFNSQNIVAIWIEDSIGQYVQTIGRYSDNANHRRYLYNWLTASNRPNTNPVPDGYLGGTFTDYQSNLIVTWDLTDPAGTLVADGTYTVRMELADRNSQSAAENNEGTFTFEKNGVTSQVTGASGGFNNVVIDYVAPDAALCGNGALDPGETCDDGGISACPTTCEADTGDACLVNVLRGEAADCTAECVDAPVNQCSDDDGCCPAGCEGGDNDCIGPSNASGSCQAIGGGPIGGLGFVLLAFGAMGARRRRRSR